jgi:hypothetical protein
MNIQQKIIQTRFIPTVFCPFFGRAVANNNKHQLFIIIFTILRCGGGRAGA